ncbi:MAG: hypothetical protein GTO18_16275 [Anaerolineales bacterium]|nr:hypothetical protein [Anaerolineales bacterium]
MDFWNVLGRGYSWLYRAFWILVLIFLISRSTVQLSGPVEQVRTYTSDVEFEFLGWTLGALAQKFEQFGLGAASYLDDADRKAAVLQYFELMGEERRLEGELKSYLADPEQEENGVEAEALQEALGDLRDEMAKLQPFVETILQEQVAYVLADLGMGAGGAVFPPVAFEFTKVPVSLIVSPREIIDQMANIPLDPGLTLDQKITLEEQVDVGLDASSLVVNIGGIGTYPTMVVESGSLPWVINTIAHEWVHNYLTLRPLGINFYTSPDMRTMNETVASIVGDEVGRQVLRRYYPELLPPEEAAESSAPEEPPADPPAFDFRAEMHETRIMADQLLAEGRIEEAEEYMESRRQVFWEHGYRIRKLNQAYFAFHGAYADVPEGPAGKDPVGEAVRDLWSLIDSPAEFLRKMAWMNEFADLLEAIEVSKANR